jgi:hypothetical protein
MAGELKVSNMIWVMRSLLARGFRGASVRRTGCSSGGDTELVVEGVVPDLLHIVPVGDDTVLDGVLQGQHTTLGLGLISDVGVLLVHADHDTGHLRPADDGRKDGTGSVITGETGLAHTGTVVNNQGLDFVVSHCEGGVVLNY